MISKYDAWLSAAPDTSDEDEYIEQRVFELLKTELNPTDICHIAEAISEAGELEQATIIDFVNQKNWEALGRKLYFISYEYMEHLAVSRAEHEIQQGYSL